MCPNKNTCLILGLFYFVVTFLESYFVFVLIYTVLISDNFQLHPWPTKFVPNISTLYDLPTYRDWRLPSFITTGRLRGAAAVVPGHPKSVRRSQEISFPDLYMQNRENVWQWKSQVTLGLDNVCCQNIISIWGQPYW